MLKQKLVVALITSAFAASVFAQAPARAVAPATPTTQAKSADMKPAEAKPAKAKAKKAKKAKKAMKKTS